MNGETTGYSELILLGARDTDQLASEIERLAHFLEQAPSVFLRDVAYTCAVAWRAQEHKGATLAVVASSAEELRARLVAALPRVRGGAERIRDKSGTYFFRTPLLGPGGGKLAFVFPGAASFYPDMLRDLAISFPECRAAFDELEEALAGNGNFSPSSFIFPPAAHYRRDADVFLSGAYAQAMVSTYSANAALFGLYARLGVTPEGVAGFAGGDLNALAAAGCFGVFNRPARLNFLKDMYRMVDSAIAHAGLPTCVLAAIVSPHPGACDAALAAFGADQVQTFFELTPRQRMIAIASGAYAEVWPALTAAGVKGMKLAMDRPFNTAWCAKIVPVFRKFAARWACVPATVPVWSCATAAPLPARIRAARATCAEAWAEPVRLGETLRRMYAEGYRVFLEVGPRGMVTNAVDDILRGLPHVALASNLVHRSGLLQFHHATGCLAALGATFDPTVLFAHHRCRRLDFDYSLSLEVRADAEMVLQREFPSLALLSGDSPFASAPAAGRPRAKAQARAAAVAARERRQRQFDFGATIPLISDMDVIAEEPGVSVEIEKTLDFAHVPYLADAAVGTSNVSYTQPNLRGLALLPLATGAEIMAELAQLLAPNRSVIALDNLQRRRIVAFRNEKLRLFVRAERLPAEHPDETLVRVQLRDDAPDSAWTLPAMETTVVLSAKPPVPESVAPEMLVRPRSVHWTENDIYPYRLSAGARLRYVRQADLWGDGGLDYEVETPPSAGAVDHTRFPVWILNPLLLQAITDGYSLWRSHERFPGAFSFAFRLRHLALQALSIPEGQRLRCYLRLRGVTPRSHICDITVTDGNGTRVMTLGGYEENTERVPVEYRQLVLQPPLAFLTDELSAAVLGTPKQPFASAVVTDVPYPIFTRNEEIWLKTVSQIVLGKVERRHFAEMIGGVNRRTEWLFGRIAAKEAVRRFLWNNYQSRWTDADVEIWADDSGKPHAIGDWTNKVWKDKDGALAPLDLAIAHTAQFVVAVVATRARVGVDVEATDRDLSEEFTRGVFAPEELALIESAAAPHVAAIRFWCAKEALSKALGTGIRYSPRELVVSALQPETGEMTLALQGAWAENFKTLRGRTVSVSSAVVRGHAIASCFLPESWFHG